MSLEQLTEAIVSHLRTALPGLRVEHFPDVVDRRAMFSARQDLLVAYEADAYGKTESFDPPSKARTITVSVTLLVRSLRGAQGAQARIEQVRQALWGFATPLGGYPLEPERTECLGEDQGIWMFVSYFTTTTWVVATTTPLTGPTLTEVSADSEIP